MVGSHTGSRIVCYSPQLYAASPGLVGLSGLYGIKVAPCWKCTDSFLSLGPGLLASCCYWVLCSPTAPCMARVILPSIKHQASSLEAQDQRDPGAEPQAPQPAGGSRAPELEQNPGTGPPGRVSSDDGVACGLCISPSHRHGADKFNIRLPRPSIQNGARRRGGKPASVSFNPRRRPSATPQTSTQCDQSLTHSIPILLNPAHISSYGLVYCVHASTVPAKRKLLAAYSVSSLAPLVQRTAT